MAVIASRPINVQQIEITRDYYIFKFSLRCKALEFGILFDIIKIRIWWSIKYCK